MALLEKRCQWQIDECSLKPEKRILMIPSEVDTRAPSPPRNQFGEPSPPPPHVYIQLFKFEKRWINESRFLMGGCCVRRLIRIIYLHGSRRAESNPRWRNVSGGASQEETRRDCDRIGQLFRTFIGITRQNNVMQPIRISPTSVFGVLLSWSWFLCSLTSCFIVKLCVSHLTPPVHHPPLSVCSVFSRVSDPCCLQCLCVGCFCFLFLVFSLICLFVSVLVHLDSCCWGIHSAFV